MRFRCMPHWGIVVGARNMDRALLNDNSGAFGQTFRFSRSPPPSHKLLIFFTFIALAVPKTKALT